MKAYGSPAEALRDGLRLSEAMTLKFASVDVPQGGGKAVIALPDATIPVGTERRRLLREFGFFVTSLGGLYSCAPDMNTSAEGHGRHSRGLPLRFLQDGGRRRLG